MCDQAVFDGVAAEHILEAAYCRCDSATPSICAMSHTSPKSIVRTPTPLVSDDSAIAKAKSSKDFGLLSVPKRLRHDPNKPFHFGTLMNISFGFASAFSECFGAINKA